VDVQTLIAGVGAIATGAGGCLLVIHELRRRDRRALKRELDDLSVDVTELRHDIVICRRYAYMLGEKLAEHGIELPEPDPLHHEGGPR
jgi:hypothetical protein